MTKRLYFDSPELAEWQTGIREVIRREDGIYAILEETAFYPHGGGQPCDLGAINGIPVVDVVSVGEEVLHKLEQAPEGRTAECRLDWTRRFDHMQQHSGQHLLSAVFRSLYGAHTLSFHLGADYSAIDLDIPELAEERRAAAELEANRLIYENRSILSYFVTEEEAAGLELAKQPQVTGALRIVEISGVEHNACGGTHLSSTGQLGLIKLLKTEKMKGNTRLFFKCGYRALEDYNGSQRILSELSVRFNTGKEGILERVEKREDEMKEMQQELSLLKEKLEAYAVQELLAERGNGGIARIFVDKPFKDVQSLAHQLAAAGDFPVLLLAAAENKLVLARGGGYELHCGEFLKAHLAAFKGKGGGSDKTAQAGFSSPEDALGFYECAKGELFHG